MEGRWTEVGGGRRMKGHAWRRSSPLPPRLVLLPRLLLPEAAPLLGNPSGPAPPVACAPPASHHLRREKGRAELDVQATTWLKSRNCDFSLNTHKKSKQKKKKKKKKAKYPLFTQDISILFFLSYSINILFHYSYYY